MAAVQGNLQGPKVLEILEQAEKITKPDLFATPFVRAALVQGERKQQKNVIQMCLCIAGRERSTKALRTYWETPPKPVYLPWEWILAPGLFFLCSAALQMFVKMNVQLFVCLEPTMSGFTLWPCCAWLLCPKSFCFYLAGEGRKMLETLLYLVRHDSSFKC